MVLSSKRDFVAEWNAFKLNGLGSEIVNYQTITYKKDGTEKHSKNQLAVGCKAIITKNMTVDEVAVYNGMRVTVVNTMPISVQVITEDGKIITLTYT